MGSNSTASPNNNESALNLVIRQGVSLVSVLIHLSLFWPISSIGLWILLFIQGVIYAPLLHFIAKKYQASSVNLLMDNAVYGFCLGLWGLNPFLAAFYIASASIIDMASGGLKYFAKGMCLLLLLAVIGATIQGWQFRPDIPLTTTIIAAIGFIAFLMSLGVRIFNINTRLRQTRTDLEDQKQELLNLNALAYSVNSHLDVDIILRGVMETIERLYPFEAMYILAFNEQEKTLEVLGIYGSNLTEDEHNAFRMFQFDLERDAHSLFVSGLVKRKVIYVPHITKDMVKNGAKTDRDLFSVKPSLSLVYFPVYVEDQVIAGACFINYEKEFRLQESDIHCIERYLIQVGTAVRNATLFKELKKSKQQAETAQQKAEESEEAKGRFLANMSHEIRTPLTAIMGYSEALMDKDTNADERSTFIGHILRSGKHLLSMINDILDISKIEAHKISIERIDCDLLEIICDLDSYLQIKAQAKKLEYKIEVEFPIPHTIKSDPTRIKQVLLNLTNNAVKFTESGQITLRLSVQKDDYLAIEVADTGIGINQEDHDKIFSAFDQADTSTTRLFGGTGLGLYISKNLAQLLGGDLTFSSEKGVGSTFTLTTLIGTIDRNYIHDADEFSVIMDRVKESKTFSSIPNLAGKMLVADDNPHNQNLAERLIKQTGLEVDVVENGLLAVQAVGKTAYCAILMDMQMPVMGGKDAALEIQKLGITTPIIAFTANVMKHQVEEYRDLGFFDVLEKPINRAQLFSTLQTAVRKNDERPSKVLVVDDNEINQMILARYITKHNEQAEVTLTLNGSEAVDMVKADSFDLIFMDMEMPVMGGLEATQRIRKLGVKTPIYMVTGNTDTEDINRCINSGADGHLAKPIEKEIIFQLLTDILITPSDDRCEQNQKVQK